MKISGQCHCGTVAFTALVDASKVVACHCEDCQKFSGAPFRAVIPVPVENVQLLGQPRHYVKVAASGNRRAQAFCGECGTQLYATEADTPIRAQGPSSPVMDAAALAERWKRGLVRGAY